MRKELQKQFSDVLAKNYLDLRRHGQAILKLLSCDPNDFTIICVSNDLSRIADVVGQGQHRLFVLNSRVADVVGEGHFDPLFLTMSTEQEPDGPQQEQPALEALPRALEQQADSEALPSLQEQQPPPEGLPIAHQQPASEKPSAQRKQPTPVMQPKPDNSAHSASDVNTFAALKRKFKHLQCKPKASKAEKTALAQRTSVDRLKLYAEASALGQRLRMQTAGEIMDAVGPLFFLNVKKLREVMKSGLIASDVSKGTMPKQFQMGKYGKGTLTDDQMRDLLVHVQLWERANRPLTRDEIQRSMWKFILVNAGKVSAADHVDWDAYDRDAYNLDSQYRYWKEWLATEREEGRIVLKLFDKLLKADS